LVQTYTLNYHLQKIKSVSNTDAKINADKKSLSAIFFDWLLARPRKYSAGVVLEIRFSRLFFITLSH
jgi:hypothetical protein